MADKTANMTMAELDAFVAERMKPENLPAWWYDDFKPEKKCGHPEPKKKRRRRRRKRVAARSRPSTG